MRPQLWHVLFIVIILAMAVGLAVVVIASARSSQRGNPPTVGPGPQYPGTGPHPYSGTYGDRPAGPGAAGAAGSASSPGAIDPEKRLVALRELAQMRKDGLLTEEEYQAEVRRLG
ncbi:SHOCT domain-containing protein [Occultella gossypii]|uniref:SHOCT domain-containing protein n=1 Tax=Occultella gossypii TaxID=2800820 RepID=A0ABS7S3Z7_9MICO|nr:SHOCT domain-containing protein [Occultella gossypii]MBZ2195022.1 SHOCT domain-containing protein [Occultella gossypii]